MNAQNLLFMINPEFNNIPKMKKFILNRYHITFESASTLNKTKWFDVANKKGYLQAMKSYRNSTKINKKHKFHLTMLCLVFYLSSYIPYRAIGGAVGPAVLF